MDRIAKRILSVGISSVLVVASILGPGCQQAVAAGVIRAGAVGSAFAAAPGWTGVVRTLLPLVQSDPILNPHLVNLRSMLTQTSAKLYVNEVDGLKSMAFVQYLPEQFRANPEAFLQLDQQDQIGQLAAAAQTALDDEARALARQVKARKANSDEILRLAEINSNFHLSPNVRRTVEKQLATVLQADSNAASVQPALGKVKQILAEHPLRQGAVFDSARRATSLDASEAPVAAVQALGAARNKFYALAGGQLESGNVQLSKIATPDRIGLFQSKEFQDWVAAERAEGRRVFWLKDLDKTQAAGDIFTFFFQWRAENNKFTPAQNEIMSSFLKGVKIDDPSLKAELDRVGQNDAAANAKLVIKLWRNKDQGGEGISLHDFWLQIYWPTQRGLARKEKLEQVAQFAPHYAAKIYPGVRDENQALQKAGVDVVIVSNGDQELARAVAPLLGIKYSNVVGSNLVYKDGVAADFHTYEIFDKEWQTKPQPGKSLAFHYWINANKWRWKWKTLDLRKIVVAGVDGDSAASDGGMMALLPPGSSIGNFMVDTPREPNRLKKFYALAEKYGWTRGQFFTLLQDPSAPGAWEDSIQTVPYPKDQSPQEILPGIAYSVLNQVTDWSKGHTTVFVGKKKGNKPDGTSYASREFLQDLKAHVDRVLAAFREQGLLGYIVYATQGLEFAIMNWESEERMGKAFQSGGGKSVAADGGRMFEPQPMVWEKMEGFAGVLTKEILEAYLRRVSQ